MVKAGDKVKAIGIGEMFVGLVEGSSGEGEVLHVGYGDGTHSTSDFDEKPRLQHFFEEQYNEGVFYRDNGCGEVLWLALDDYEIL
jgi:hypothetical protein